MMRVCEMNEADLLALTDEQVEKLVDYECAVQGAPLLPPYPEPAPESTKFDPDVPVFQVAGVIVKDAEQAARILQAIIDSGPIFKEDYNNGLYVVKETKPEDYYFPKIERKNLYSLEHYVAIRDEKAAHEQRVKAHSALMKEYNDTKTARKDISDEVWETVNAARNRKWRRDCIRSDFARYLELAQDNKTIAMRFLLKGKPSIETEFTELVQELCPGYGEPETTCEPRNS